MRHHSIRWGTLVAFCVALLPAGCGLTGTRTTVLVNSTVNVPRSTGTVPGSAQVMFQGLPGQTINIIMTGGQKNMLPYGSVLSPDGATTSVPPLSSAASSSNTGSFTATTLGTYTLYVYDGANLGGQIQVWVEVAGS